MQPCPDAGDDGLMCDNGSVDSTITPEELNVNKILLKFDKTLFQINNVNKVPFTFTPIFLIMKKQIYFYIFMKRKDFYMDNHGKKMIAPIIIAVIFVLYYGGFAAVCLFLPEIPILIKLMFGIIPLALAGVMIYVVVTRIKEIRSGEEDDLSKY